MHSSFLIDYLAGVCGGCVVVLVGHPFDTTKTRMQVAPPALYTSTADCIRKTWKAEGIRGFYSGMTSPLLGQMFFRASSFMTFHSTLQALNALHPESLSTPPSSSVLMAAGGITGFIISFIEAPIDLVKTKMQTQIFAVQNSPAQPTAGGVASHLAGSRGISTNSSATHVHYKSVSHAVTSIAQQHGYRALFQGLSATIVRNVPANAVFFPVNEIVKEQFVHRRNSLSHSHSHALGRPHSQQDLDMWERVVAGASAGLCYWVGVYPLDRVKGRMQGVPWGARLSWLATTREIVSKEGLRGLFRGLAPCALRAVPACSALFVTMDLVKIRLSSLQQQLR